MSEHAKAEQHSEAAHGGGGGGGGSHGGGGGGHGPGGGAHEEHEGAPEWLISFADNVALLMGFFVILLAMNMAKQTQGGMGGEGQMGGAPDRMMEFVIAVRSAFHSPIDINSKRPEDQQVIKYMLERSGGPNTIDGPKGRFDNMQSLPNGTVVKPAAVVEFDEREAVLSAEARTVLTQTAGLLKDQRWIIEVRGHVGPHEVMRQAVKARELSYQRAMAAAGALVESGLKWDNLRVVACGDSARVVPRAEGAQEDRTNQRVEIVVTTDVAQPDPYGRPVAEAGVEH